MSEQTAMRVLLWENVSYTKSEFDHQLKVTQPGLTVVSSRSTWVLYKLDS